MTTSYAVRAHNAATASENKIHDDEVARSYGFEGGLVPGVTVYAYLTHLVVAALRRQWLERGTMGVRFVRPCYEGDDVTIDATVRDVADDRIVELTARRRSDEVVATATASLPLRPQLPPAVDNYPVVPLPTERTPATAEALASLGDLGTCAATYRAQHAPAFLDEIGEDLAVYRTERLAHPGYLLLSANAILSANVRVGPWMHVGSEITNFGIVTDGEQVSTRGRIAKLFDRKGHRFAELDLLLVTNQTRPVQHVRHTVIYEIAAPG